MIKVAPGMTVIGVDRGALRRDRRSVAARTSRHS